MEPDRPSISVLERGIRVEKLEISSPELAEYLRGRSHDERAMMFIQAAEVGVFCLERAAMSQDVDFVRRQIEVLLHAIEQAVGALPHAIRKEFVSVLGSGEGQVLAPVEQMVTEAAATMTERVNGVKDLLANDLDPDRRTSILGRALSELKDLLDPRRSDSIHAALERAVETVTARDGVLAQAVASVVGEVVRPLAEEIARLGQQLAVQDAVEEATKNSPQKGSRYEEVVVADLQRWAAAVGAEVHHVGADNRPGDILIRFPASSLADCGSAIVIETRDRVAPLGRKAIADLLDRAMARREAASAIYLSRDGRGLAREIGGWGEGECQSGPYVATTHENLIVALRFLLAQLRLSRLREALPRVDQAAIEGQIGRIRTALGRIAMINRKVTEIRGGADGIRQEAETLRNDIRSALLIIEEALRGSGPGEASRMLESQDQAEDVA